MIDPGEGDRTGASVVEALTALLLTLGLISLMGGFAVRHRRAADVVVRRSEVVEARRVIRDLLDDVVASGGLAMDADPTVREGEIAVRFFAGWARPCGPSQWAYRGRRLPEAGRDSAWILSPTGGTGVVAVSSASRGDCPRLMPGEDALELSLDPGAGPPVLLRIFEAGRFRLSDAFRYGRLSDPAQPLTGAVLDPRDSGLEWSRPGVGASVRGLGDSSVIARRWRPR